MNLNSQRSLSFALVLFGTSLGASYAQNAGDTSGQTVQTNNPFPLLFGKTGQITSKFQLFSTAPIEYSDGTTANGCEMQAIFSARLTKAGAMSGTVMVGGKVIRLGGRFNPNWRLVIPLPQGFAETELVFSVNWPDQTQTPTLALTPQKAGVPTSSVLAMSVGKHTNPWLSKYTGTFVISSSEKKGYVTTQALGDTGRVVISGVLPSGDHFAGMSVLHDDVTGAKDAASLQTAEVSLNLGTNQTLVSTMEFAPGSLGGQVELRTLKPKGPNKQVVDKKVWEVTGYPYTPNLPFQASGPGDYYSRTDFGLTLTSGSLTLNGGTLKADGTQLKVSQSGVSDPSRGLVLNFNPSTGVFNGLVGVTDNSSGSPVYRTQSFSGVLLQGASNSGVGITAQGLPVQVSPLLNPSYGMNFNTTVGGSTITVAGGSNYGSLGGVTLGASTGVLTNVSFNNPGGLSAVIPNQVNFYTNVNYGGIVGGAILTAGGGNNTGGSIALDTNAYLGSLTGIHITSRDTPNSLVVTGTLSGTPAQTGSGTLTLNGGNPPSNGANTTSGAILILNPPDGSFTPPVLTPGTLFTGTLDSSVNSGSLNSSGTPTAPAK